MRITSDNLLFAAIALAIVLVIVAHGDAFAQLGTVFAN
jgi:hypothetical protein